MNYIEFPEHLQDDMLQKMDQNHLIPESYRQFGALILRRVIPSELIDEWIDAWKAFYLAKLADGRMLDPYNQVVLHEPVPEVLEKVHLHPVLLDIMQGLYPDLGFYLQRFIIKDSHNREAVFPHQDFCYNLGWPDKTSVMLPLGPMNPDNGGLVLYPGTHHLGYLGDAGEIDLDILDPKWPVVAPELEPGDLILMHDCTWHSSPPRKSDLERIMLQITYQPASDPSTTKVLRGNSNMGLSLMTIERDRFFKRSRAGRLQELQAQVNKLDG